MPECRRHILEKKRVALMRHLIKQEGYDDHTLADDIELGFDLVGDSPASSVLPSKLVPATISKEDLLRHSEKANKALRYMTRSSGDPDLDRGLWDSKSRRAGLGAPCFGMSCLMARQFPGVFLWHSLAR